MGIFDFLKKKKKEEMPMPGGQGAQAGNKMAQPQAPIANPGPTATTAQTPPAGDSPAVPMGGGTKMAPGGGNPPQTK